VLPLRTTGRVGCRPPGRESNWCRVVMEHRAGRVCYGSVSQSGETAHDPAVETCPSVCCTDG